MCKMKVVYWELLNEVFAALNNMKRSWGATIAGSACTDAMAKQALNVISTYFLAAYCENEGTEVVWENIPKIATYRSFEKFFVKKDTPDYIFDETFHYGNIKKSEIGMTAQEILVERTDIELKEFLYEGMEASQEVKMYRAGTRIASYVELLKDEFCIPKIEFATKKQQTREKLKEFYDISPIVEQIANCENIDALQLKTNLNEGEKLFIFLNTILKLKNQIRWIDKFKLVDCTVQGHLFDTAVISYFMALEIFENEKLATKLFFTGIFHDIAETWTTDIASPIKDRIAGLRQATEVYEQIMLAKHIYDVFPDFLTKKLKNVSMEDQENAVYKKFMKGADYFSADLECLRQLIGGSRDIYYYNVLIEGKKKIEDVQVNITPTSNVLRNRICDYAQNLKNLGQFFEWYTVEE